MWGFFCTSEPKATFKKQDDKYKQITGVQCVSVAVTCVRTTQTPGALKTLNHMKLVQSTNKKVTIVENTRKNKWGELLCSYEWVAIVSDEIWV